MLTMTYKDGDYWIEIGTKILICTEKQAIYNLSLSTKKAETWIKFAQNNPGIATVVL
jgi:hypothetical protein